MLKLVPFLLFIAVCLSACSSSDPAPDEDGAAPAEQVVVPPVPDASSPAAGPSETVRRTMRIADILYEARTAFEDNRLLRPRANNAYERYREVLGLDPGNAVALQGIEDIIRRYVQLADHDMRLGHYDGAQALLDRAASIEDHPQIRAARERLQQARQSRVEFFALEPQALRQQSASVIARLGEIARAIRDEGDLTFVITARSDEEGRWIYKIMREAVQGHRLRANITLGNEPGIRVQ